MRAMERVLRPRKRMTVSTDISFSWTDVRFQFALDPDWIHLGASQFIASHPRVVREAIERHRRALDRDPVQYVEDNEDPRMQAVREAAAHYMGVRDADEIALTDSTTMGLGLLWSGLPLRDGDEVVTTDHEHYSQYESLRGLRERAGVTTRKVTLYDGRAADADPEDMVRRLTSAVGPRTRAMAVTWVQSDTGLKLPVRALADALARVNASRPDDARVLLCVDGVHGFGIEDVPAAALGCDAFVAGTHKWIHGPRGTGLMWMPAERWTHMRRVIPSFTETMDAYSEDEPPPGPMTGRRFTPGGFHSLEHRWAAADAFHFLEGIGRTRVAARVHELARQCREGLARMRGITLHTPMSDALSAGIVAFEIRGMKSKDAMQRLREQRIISTVAPYPTAYLRFTPGIINTPEEVERGLAAVGGLV